MMSPSRSPAGRGRAVRFGRDDEHAARLRQLVEARHPPQQRHVLAREAEIAPPYESVAEQRRQDRQHRANRHREAQALTAGDDRGVHADDRAARLVTSGPPELPGFSAASVWMTWSISRPDARAQRPAERAHDAGRHRVLETVGIADRDHELSGPKRLRIAELDRRQIPAR